MCAVTYELSLLTGFVCQNNNRKRQAQKEAATQKPNGHAWVRTAALGALSYIANR